MKDDILNTIEVLTGRVRAKEEEANKLKKLVNELCGEAGVPVRFADVSEVGASLSAIRPDLFYSLTLTAAIRNYLDLRKAANLGAASVLEIFRAIKDGGYKFDTKNEENAKISVGNALRKTSSIFHRLPNGHYGLLTWYPSAKAQPNGATKAKGKREHIAKKQNKTANLIEAARVTNKEISDVILSQTGQFQGSDIEAAIKVKFPSKELPKSKTPTVLFILKKKGLVKEASPRSGKRGAVYIKA